MALVSDARTGAAGSVVGSPAWPSSAAGDSAQIRPIGPDEWPVLREIRLAALQDAPYAFCSTYADALGQTEEYWRGWLEPGIVLLAWHGGAPVGMVRVGPFRDDASAAGIYSMWVRPSHRGTGVADALIAAALAWAQQRGHARAVLEVVAGNERAVRAYERNGFAYIDLPCSYPGGRVMAHPLARP